MLMGARLHRQCVSDFAKLSDEDETMQMIPFYFLSQMYAIENCHVMNWNMQINGATYTGNMDQESEMEMRLLTMRW